MPRITLSVADREHMALKLLALQRNQKMVAIIEQAIKQYLQAEGAYDLVIQSIGDQGGRSHS
jgi:predicted transcriptional regulator